MTCQPTHTKGGGADNLVSTDAVYANGGSRADSAALPFVENRCKCGHGRVMHEGLERVAYACAGDAWRCLCAGYEVPAPSLHDRIEAQNRALEDILQRLIALNLDMHKAVDLWTAGLRAGLVDEEVQS